MPRPNIGPQLVWLEKRKKYYIRWYENGRKLEKSTFSSDRARAETALANFLIEFQSLENGGHPNNVLINDFLEYYYREHAVHCISADRVRYCINNLNMFWSGKVVAAIDRRSCNKYVRFRQESRFKGIKHGTIRKELGTQALPLTRTRTNAWLQNARFCRYGDFHRQNYVDGFVDRPRNYAPLSGTTRISTARSSDR